jgi:adenylylsulfate kinase
MGSTYKRSFLKGLCWEIISFMLTFALIYLLYGNVTTALKPSFIITLVKVPFYFMHERVWKRVSWGKIPTEWYYKKLREKEKKKIS